MSKQGLSNTLLGRRVKPQPYILDDWFGVSKLAAWARADAHAKYGLVPVPDAWCIASDKGEFWIKREQVRDTGPDSGIVLHPGTIRAAWASGDGVKVAVESVLGESKEFILSHLLLQPE